MKKWVVCILVFFPFASLQAEGGIGESMGIDFYSQIERGNYAIKQKLLQTRLAEYRDMNEFISDCGVRPVFAPNTKLESREFDALLREVKVGNTSTLMRLLSRPGSSETLDTNTLTLLYMCLNEKHSRLEASTERQTQNMSTLSSLGIYSDGTTENSDYDLMSDIDKINSIIFIEKIPYTGTKNIGRLSLLDLLSGNVPGLPSVSSSGVTSASTTVPPPVGIGGIETPPAPPTREELHLGESLAAGWCSETSVIPFSNPDASLLREIESIVRYGVTDTRSEGVGGRYADVSLSQNTTPATSISLSRTSTSEKADQYDEPNCDGILCIKIKMVPSQTNLLGGSTNLSIESLLSTRLKEIDEISRYDLSAQSMTQGFYESTRPGMKFWKNIGGLRTFMYEKPAISQKLKTEEKPEDTEARRWRCAASSAGLLSTDWVASNAFRAEGFMNKHGANTITLPSRSVEMGAIDMDLYKQSGLCLEQEIVLSRKGYYDSLSTEVNEIQGFTHAFLEKINDTIAQIDLIARKPTIK